MKRFPVIAGLSGGLVAVVAILLMGLTTNAQAANGPARLAIQGPAWPNASGLLAPTAPVTCTLSITTTDPLPGNTSFSTAILLGTAGGLSLVPTTGVPPGTTVDVATQDRYFYTNASAGNTVMVKADPQNSASGNYNLGIDVFDSGQNLIAQDADTSDFSASVTIIPKYTGIMYFKIYQLNAAARCTGGYYNIEFTNSTPTPAPSQTPTPTKTIGPSPTGYAGAPGVDRFEPNNDFDHATTIGLNVKYDKLNFVEWIPSDDGWDNDFFRVRVKPGMLIKCSTLDLAPGTDTNLILYDDSRNGINGNDDVNRAAGDLSSSVTYYTTYEGWLYALVGEGFHRPVIDQANTGYSFECTVLNQDTPTPVPTPTLNPNIPTVTPTPTQTPIPSPTSTPLPVIIIVKPLPTPTPPGLPTSQIPVSLLAYYDANGNNKYDPGEGIVGVSVRVVDLTTGNLLAQGLTDDTGRVSFTVSAPGAVQLVVPFLNYSAIIPPSGGAAIIRVSARELPNAIP